MVNNSDLENEAYRAIYSRFIKTNCLPLHFLGTGKGVRYFSEFLRDGEYYLGDAPDMLLKKNNEAIVVEHFEFDSYHVSKGKGSAGRREIKRIQRKVETLPFAVEGNFYNDEIRVPCSYRDFITNVKHSFERHYTHIEMYKSNLKKLGLIDETTVIKILFLIEDVSPLGSIASGRNLREARPCPIVLAQCEEFLTLLSEKPDVDYVLSFSSAGEKDYAWFIDTLELDEYLEHTVDYQSMYFMNFTPQIAGFKIKIAGDNDNNE